MAIEDLKRNWDALGRTDPLWAVCTEQDKKGNQWDLAEFMATGETEVWRWMDKLAVLRALPRFHRALDFGCGVGRLTQALGARFEEVVGVDVAPSMIDMARRLNSREHLRFVLNDRSDLSVFRDGEFDFVFSVIVLQHIRPQYTRGYLAEFARLLAPKGILAFQLPGELKPLPQEMFQAAIEVIDAPQRLGGGEKAALHARVTNTSPCAWPEGELLRLGNHWRQASEVVVWNDGRCWVPPLTPGASVELSLLVTAPARSGTFDLELDVVAEGVAWFADRNSSTGTVPVQVGPVEAGTQAEPLPEQPSEPEPVMEIHGIPQADVVSLLKELGLEVVMAAVSNTSTAWIDYWYVARSSWGRWLRRRFKAGWRKAQAAGGRVLRAP